MAIFSRPNNQSIATEDQEEAPVKLERIETGGAANSQEAAQEAPVEEESQEERDLKLRKERDDAFRREREQLKFETERFTQSRQ